MAKRPTQSLVMPDGNEYEFFGKTYYGVCSTAAGTVAKTVSISGFNSNSLVAGVHISVKFTYPNTTNNTTLQVSNTGAKTIYHATYTYTTTNIRWSGGDIVDFVYDGTYWCMIGVAQESYFYCETAASTQAKTALLGGSSSGFKLYHGTKVTICFRYAQSYNGIPTLNVGGSGAKSIYRDASTAAGMYAWRAGAIIDFVYDGTNWVMENGQLADTSYYGLTKLSRVISNNDSTALTPDAVYRFRDDLLSEWLWNGDSVESSITVETTTPNIEEWGEMWEQGDVGVDIQIDLSGFHQYIGLAGLKTIKITYNNEVMYHSLGYQSLSDINTEAYNNILYAFIDSSNNRIHIDTITSKAGAYPLKIELYIGNTSSDDGQFITSYMMEDYIKSKNYLTLSDLPIYDGTVV